MCWQCSKLNINSFCIINTKLKLTQSTEKHFFWWLYYSIFMLDIVQFCNTRKLFLVSIRRSNIYVFAYICELIVTYQYHTTFTTVSSLNLKKWANIGDLVIIQNAFFCSNKPCQSDSRFLKLNAKIIWKKTKYNSLIWRIQMYIDVDIILQI